MNIEQLLYPRWLVLSSYPGCHAEEGSIITFIGNRAIVKPPVGEEYDAVKLWFDRIEAYPKLWRKMGWWENRPLSDFPYFIKKDDKVYAVQSWDIEARHGDKAVLGKTSSEIWREENPYLETYARHFLPATEAEYYAFTYPGGEWWAHIKLGDLPKHIKMEINGELIHVCKVQMWQPVDGSVGAWVKGDGVVRMNKTILPATESEYLKFITQTT